jgi:hypothetical protein
MKVRVDLGLELDADSVEHAIEKLTAAFKYYVTGVTINSIGAYRQLHFGDPDVNEKVEVTE